jgi:WD40 repeat protein
MFARFRPAVLFVVVVLMRVDSVPAQSPRRDAHGDPLPKDVRFRLGTARLRHEGAVHALAWMPDGKTLASAGLDGTVRLWRVADGKELRRFKSRNGTFLALAITRDGRLLASGGSGSGIHIWETATGKEVRWIKDKESMIRSLDFSADGKMLAVCGLATKVCLYAVESGEKLRELGRKEAVFASAAFSPDGKKLLAGGRKHVVCLDSATGAEVRKLPTEAGPIFQLVFSADGKRLAAVQGLGEGQVWLWNWPEAKRLHRLPVTPAT